MKPTKAKKEQVCKWQEPYEAETDEGWQPACDEQSAFISGDLNDLREMKDTYTFCPKCGKKIQFKGDENAKENL